MTSSLNIEHHKTVSGGEFRASLGEETARLTYKNRGSDTIVADHTGVPSAFRGQGVAAELVKALAEFAEGNGLKIVPQCSYVAAQAKRHPEWSGRFI